MHDTRALSKRGITLEKLTFGQLLGEIAQDATDLKSSPLSFPFDRLAPPSHLPPSRSSRSRLTPFVSAFPPSSLSIYSVSPVPSYFIPLSVTRAEPITTWAETMGSADKPGASQSNPFERANCCNFCAPFQPPLNPRFLVTPTRRSTAGNTGVYR